MTTAKKPSTTKPKTQIAKFREAARELETDDSEEVFDRTLQKITKVKPDGKPSDRLGRTDTLKG